MPAGASTGTAQISPEQAGYTATGAQFKTIDARVFLRQPTQYAGEVASFGHSVQLWSSGLVISVGLTASTSGGGYATYATIYDRSTHQVIASNPNAQHCAGYGDFCAPGPVTWNYPGTTAWLRISYTPADGHLSMSEVLSSDSTDSNGNDFTSSYDLTASQPFTQARVGTEFGSSPWDASYPYTPPAKSLKVAAYTSVDLTSYSGHTASLSSWWVHHPAARQHRAAIRPRPGRHPGRPVHRRSQLPDRLRAAERAKLPLTRSRPDRDACTGGNAAGPGSVRGAGESSRSRGMFAEPGNVRGAGH